MEVKQWKVSIDIFTIVCFEPPLTRAPLPPCAGPRRSQTCSPCHRCPAVHCAPPHSRCRCWSRRWRPWGQGPAAGPATQPSCPCSNPRHTLKYGIILKLRDYITWGIFESKCHNIVSCNISQKLTFAEWGRENLGHIKHWHHCLGWNKGRGGQALFMA